MKSSIHRLLSRRNLLRNTALMALLAPVIRQLEVRRQLLLRLAALSCCSRPTVR